MACRISQAFTLIEDERSILVTVVDRALGLIVGVVVSKEAIGLWTRGSLDDVGIGAEGARIHVRQDQSEDWVWKRPSVPGFIIK